MDKREDIAQKILDMDLEATADDAFVRESIESCPNSLGMEAMPYAPCRIARNIIINYYNRHGFGEAEAIHGMAADPANLLLSKIVDVGFVDRSGKNLVALDIQMEAGDTKAYALRRNGFEEIFCLIYPKGLWVRFTGNPEERSRCSFSHILGIDLAEYVALR